jgi:hypothetical protein
MFRNDQKVKKERKRGWLSYPSLLISENVKCDFKIMGG